MAATLVDEGIAAARQGAPNGGDVPGVLASAATGIANFINKLNGDVDRIFGRAGIAPDMAGTATSRIELGAYCDLFEEASRQTGHDNFGLWFGNQFQPRDLGLWGYAALSSPTLGSALEALVRLLPYHQESSSMRLGQGEDGLARLAYQIVAPGILQRRQDAELSLGMFLNVMREACGAGWSPEEVHFEHPKPPDHKEHEAAFSAPVYFAQGTNALLFRPEILARAMPGRDPRLFAMMETCLENLGHRPRGRDGLSERLRHAIRTRLAQGYPALDEVAEAVRLSPNTVQRQLARDGLAYKDLVEGTRQDLALLYVKQRHLPFSEIAFLLGYSELSAFSRAFRRWTGASPRAWRRKIGEG